MLWRPTDIYGVRDAMRIRLLLWLLLSALLNAQRDTATRGFARMQCHMYPGSRCTLCNVILATHCTQLRYACMADMAACTSRCAARTDERVLLPRQYPETRGLDEKNRVVIVLLIQTTMFIVTIPVNFYLWHVSNRKR